MKKFQLNIVMFIFACIALFFISCEKYLAEKPDKRLVVPSTLPDLQSLLDNSNFIIRSDPYADEASADNYYLPNTTFQNQTEANRRLYSWEKDFVFEAGNNDWSRLYRKIYYANTVLENIDLIERNTANEQVWDNVKGQALLIRAKAFMQAVMIWSPAYDSRTAASNFGLPIRLTTDFTHVTSRSSLQETYDQIIADFKQSVPLLPPTGIHTVRGSKVAAYSFLARLHLAMAKFTEAKLYADSALNINAQLLDYNTLVSTATFPIPLFNKEINFYSSFFISFLEPNAARVDSALYKSYAPNDCRKTVFFRINADGAASFKGTYNGADAGGFSGVASDEMYLTRAECLARSGQLIKAVADLDSLLKKRMKAGTFQSTHVTTQSEVLQKILNERRKELLFRGLRWMDVKRLNLEGFGITLNRKINNTAVQLLSDDLRYAIAIPEDVITLSGIPQNPR